MAAVPVPIPPADDAPHLLVVDDDRRIRDLLSRFLSTEGYRISTADSAAMARAKLSSLSFDLLILDVMMPGETGFEFARDIRKTSGVPILMLTARDAAESRITGLEIGADDYVAKPFDLREILARVRAVLRRAPPNVSAAASVLRFAGFTLDTKARTLKRESGEDVPLTNGEYELLLAFVQAPHKVQSRDQLLNATHGRDAGPYDKTIDVQVVRLRRKIERDAAQPDLIKAVRGAGYVWTADVKRDHAPSP
jgi:DNA-binding response OmpR family regulator